MALELSDPQLQNTLSERFKELPKIVQDSITSAEVEKHLRELADTNKLHIDQWQLLENEVMLTLLGFQDPEELPQNLKSTVGVSDGVAKTLAENISRIVFEPIRQQLEKELVSQQGTADEEDVLPGASHALEQAMGAPSPATATSVPVAPATPPPSPEIGAVIKTPPPPAYVPGQASHERKAIEGDPYREQLI